MNDSRMQRIRSQSELFLAGDRLWGYMRMMCVFLITLALIILGYLVHGGLGMGLLGLFSLRMLRVMVFPIAAVLGALMVAGHYVRDVYELPGLRLGMRYLIASAFSMLLPRLWIRNGRKQIREGEVNLLDTIGGPGYVSVAAGSVVLLERIKSPSNVYGMGVRYVTRFEKVKEIGSLDDQHGFIEEARATTKDGIPVVIRNVNYRYRLRTGRRYGDYMQRTPESPYPYSVQAMRNMTYGRTIRKEGQVTWSNAVRFTISSVITNYIQSHKIDHLTAPSLQDKDPREEIKRHLFARGARKRLQNVGAELLWVDIGHFDIAEDAVDEQRVETWQAKWVGSANVTRAYGDARRLAYQELGRAEAQAEMLMGVIQALEDVSLTEEPKENLRRLILMRTSQILDALTEQSEEDSKNQLPGSSSSLGGRK